MTETGTGETTTPETTPTTPETTTTTTTLTGDWRTTLPDDLKASKSLERYKDVPTLAKSFLELERKVGEKAPKFPGADAKPEDVAAWRTAVGVPESVDEYGKALKAPEGVDEGLYKGGVALLHKAHIPAVTAQRIIDGYAEYEQNALAARQQEWVEAQNALRDQWGQHKFTRAATLAHRAIERFADPEFKTFLDATGLGDHPGLFKLFAAIGEQFAEDGIVDGQVAGVPTASEAETKISELMALIHKNGQGHPDNARLTNEIMALRRRLPGGTKPVLTIG